MKNSNINIRTVSLDDAKKLLQIYEPYVLNTAVTFEYDVPSLSEFEERIKSITTKYPYLVAIIDNEIVGYAYANNFKSRKAYDWSVEVSIYVKDNLKRMGIGRRLYQQLEEILKKQNIKNLNACIAVPSDCDDEYLTKDSITFHQHMGYSLVGEFHKFGFKFDKWYNMVWMEKHIGEHSGSPKDVILFSEI